jgi:hypothetical protein
VANNVRARDLRRERDDQPKKRPADQSIPRCARTGDPFRAARRHRDFTAWRLIRDAYRGDRGNVGIIRSSVSASILPDSH